MEATTKLRAHPAKSPYNDGHGVTVNKASVKHIQWIYRCMRREGLRPADARMNLVFAVASGQRDARARVDAVLRSVG